MSVAMFTGGQLGEDAPDLVGIYDELGEAMRVASTYTGVVIIDFETGKIFSREYYESEFEELNVDIA